MKLNKQLIILSFISTLLLTTQCTANAQVEEIESLRGKWKFALGDNLNFAEPNLDDSNWETIVVPTEWESEGFRNYDGYAWYRKTVDLDLTDIKDPVYIRLGRIDDVDEVYFNGKLIGSSGGFPPNYFTAYNVDRIYAVPSNIIKKKNVIAVRVFDEGREGGIIEGRIGIYQGTHFKNSITLAGQWKFHLSDNMEWAKKNIDDAAWDNIVVPGKWENQGFRNYDGFAWYRKTFEIPSGFNVKGKMLVLGKIDDIDEVFINGVKIGGTGNMKLEWARDDEYARYRSYFIPDELLVVGKSNIIAVRVYDMVGDGGIYEGPIEIIDSKDYKDFWRAYHRDNNDFTQWIWSYFEY